MFGNSKEIAITIPLKVWQDPQSNPLLIFSESIRVVYIGCWIEAGVPADYVCKIAFKAGWASRFYAIEHLPYEIKEFHRSSVYEVKDSSWVKESSKRRLECYPEWKTWDNTTYRHFIIGGHDNYIEIIAEDFTEEIISIEKVREILPSFYQEFVGK
jgi:hypothetical protein